MAPLAGSQLPPGQLVHQLVPLLLADVSWAVEVLDLATETDHLITVRDLFVTLPAEWIGHDLSSHHLVFELVEEVP
jgi:hypothetical protein